MIFLLIEDASKYPMVSCLEAVFNTVNAISAESVKGVLSYFLNF